MIPFVLFFEPGFCDSSRLGLMPNPQHWPGRINDGLANVPPDFFAVYNRRAPMSYHWGQRGELPFASGQDETKTASAANL